MGFVGCLKESFWTLTPLTRRARCWWCWWCLASSLGSVLSGCPLRPSSTTLAMWVHQGELNCLYISTLTGLVRYLGGGQQVWDRHFAGITFLELAKEGRTSVRLPNCWQRVWWYYLMSLRTDLRSLRTNLRWFVWESELLNRLLRVRTTKTPYLKVVGIFKRHTPP